MELINFLIEHYYLSGPLLVVVFLFLISNSKKGGKRISCQTLISLSNQHKALIIDIRDSASFDASHITASKNVPSKHLLTTSNEINNNDKSIVLLCERRKCLQKCWRNT
jgi:Rhodanese-related sulfurtransferase